MKVAKSIGYTWNSKMETEIERKVINTAKEEQSVLVKTTGVEPSLTEST